MDPDTQEDVLNFNKMIDDLSGAWAIIKKTTAGSIDYSDVRFLAEIAYVVERCGAALEGLANNGLSYCENTLKKLETAKTYLDDAVQYFRDKK